MSHQYRRETTVLDRTLRKHIGAFGRECALHYESVIKLVYEKDWN